MTGKPLYDAAIVGFGPTGATLANLLARSGIDVPVVDAAREIYDRYVFGLARDATEPDRLVADAYRQVFGSDASAEGRREGGEASRALPGALLQ